MVDTTKTFVSEILQQNGYQTAVVGKWHMRCEPKGFDYYQILFDQERIITRNLKVRKRVGSIFAEKDMLRH